MSDLFLPGMTGAANTAPPCRFFLALFPDAGTAARLHALGHDTRAAHRMKGKPRSEALLHVTLHYFDDYAELPARVEHAAEMAAAKCATLPPFAVTFDRVKSFSGRPGNRPCVLVDGGSGANPELRELKRRLFSVLGPGKGERGEFVPHVTLLYDAAPLAEEAVEPVTWTVREVVLVRGHPGKGIYERYRTWPLQG